LPYQHGRLSFYQRFALIKLPKFITYYIDSLELSPGLTGATGLQDATQASTMNGAFGAMELKIFKNSLK